MYKSLSLDDFKDVELPQPTGYRLLVAVPSYEEKSPGGIIIPDKVQVQQETASNVALVVAAAPDAYSDQEKFPTGPWAEVGSWVVIAMHSGIRLKIGDQSFRLINDDTVEATISGPNAVKRG